MELIPAIDILDGRAVRLHQGDYDKVTVYADDPVEPAKRFFAAGARRIHVVDLNGAREGRPCNVSTIERILDAVDLEVQVGGGIRDEATAERWYQAGVSRVVLGTAAVRDPDMVRRVCQRNPAGVVIAIDARAGRVAVDGWLESTLRGVEELAREVDLWGAAAVLYTKIERDGTREGPDVEGTRSLQSALRATVIASGGIGSLDHIRALRDAGIRSAVCGKALYSGAIDPAEALAAAGGG